MAENALSQQIIDVMKKLGIDVELSRHILDNYNAGKYDHVGPLQAKAVPEIDGKRIVALESLKGITCDRRTAQARMDRLGASVDLGRIGRAHGAVIEFGLKELQELGVRLYPLLSYGMLNGGSSSSYVDSKKNEAFNPRLFRIYEKEFVSLEAISRGKAKGITPAFINENGIHGASFIELKMRSVLIEMLRLRALTGNRDAIRHPMFQMTSVSNHDEITSAYAGYRNSSLLKDLIESSGIDVTDVPAGVQPMLAAFTPSTQGRPKRFFLNAYGCENSPLPMPGGHGQSFIYLKDVYKTLHALGKRFVYLGNIDNIGFTVNPVCLALLALNGSDAGFEFALRTSVDVKGGVLVVDQDGRLNCADIGAAISRDHIDRLEREGKAILFNAATGLFDLDYLVRNIDAIAENIPVRISDHDKDAGRYAQAEQVTWEVIGLMNEPMIFCVDKYRRFLASKLLLEGLMASGIKLNHPDYPEDLNAIARNLSAGLENQLSTVYGLKKEGAVWIPKSVSELQQEFSADPLRYL